MTRRTLVLLGAALLLSGCSSEGSDWRQYIQVVRQSFGGNPFAARVVSRDQAAAIPYASLGYRINDGSENLLVLATDTDGEQLWTAASHVVLMMRGGRVVRTVGLTHDVGATTPGGTGALPPLLGALKGSYRSTRQVDLPDIGAYAVTLNCTTVARGRQTISIIGSSIPTIRVDETCESLKPRWRFTDNYWLDPDSGFVWHSIQHIHPATLIQIEIFRPPG